MELLRCFQKQCYESIQLGMNFEDFQLMWSPTKPLQKSFYHESGTYICRVRDAQFFFMEDQLSHVVIKVLATFFEEPRKVFSRLTLDKTIQIWTAKEWEWSIDRFHTAGQHIALTCTEFKNVSFEFELYNRHFFLDEIRVEIRDAIWDRQSLIRHMQSEI